MLSAFLMKKDIFNWFTMRTTIRSEILNILTGYILLLELIEFRINATSVCVQNILRKEVLRVWIMLCVSVKQQTSVIQTDNLNWVQKTISIVFFSNILISKIVFACELLYINITLHNGRNYLALVECLEMTNRRKKKNCDNDPISEPSALIRPRCLLFVLYHVF